MIDRMLMSALCLAASVILLPGCTTIFPDREGTDTRTTTPDNTDTWNGYVPPTALFGQGCQPQTSLTVDNCAPPESCMVLSSTLQTTMCTHDCKSDAECAADARCTTTPVGKVCVPRCSQDFDCQGRISSLRCITVNADDAVCWTPDANTGEVMSIAAPIIERIELARCDGTGVCSSGLPVPGADIQTTIYLGNYGVRDLASLSATVIPKSGSIKNLTGSTGSVPILSGNATGVQTISPRFTIAPEVTPGTKLDFTLRLVSPANEVFEPTFTITAFGSAALVWVTDFQLSESGAAILEAKPGTTVSVLLQARNLGFGDAIGVDAGVSVVGTDATLVAGTPYSPDLPDASKSPTPADPQPVYQGQLTIAPTATADIVLDVILSDDFGGEWAQKVTIPVVGP